jgi:hypothetical protein
VNGSTALASAIAADHPRVLPVPAGELHSKILMVAPTESGFDSLPANGTSPPPLMACSISS